MRSYLFTPSGPLAALAVVAFLGRGALVAADEPTKTVVGVDVYYESLCGDSMRWVKNQLVPAYPGLKDHLNVTFVPYGKATHRRESESDPWQFTCQHGPAECQGNKAQSCAIHSIRSLEQPKDHQRLTVNLVGCAMSSTYPATAVPQCAQSVGLSAETQSAILSCLKSNEGDDLLALNGDKTLALDPVLVFVPTITINGVNSRENQSAALSNFAGLICGLLQQDEKPDVCARSS